VQLRALLERARVATAARNELLHDLWVQELDGGEFLIGGDKPRRRLPSVEQLDELPDEIKGILVALNCGRLEKDAFLLVALDVT